MAYHRDVIESSIAARVCSNAKIADQWRDYAVQMELRILDNQIEAEAMEARPGLWLQSNPWDMRPINKYRWENKKRKARF
jgi:hypothetical protein